MSHARGEGNFFFLLSFSRERKIAERQSKAETRKPPNLLHQMPSRDSAARHYASTTCSSCGSPGATSTTAHAHQHHGTISPGQEKASTASRTSGRGHGCARGGMRRLRARRWRTSRACVHGLSALRRAPRYREASRISMIVRRIGHFGCRLRGRMWGGWAGKLVELMRWIMSGFLLGKIRLLDVGISGLALLGSSEKIHCQFHWIWV